MGAKEIQNLHLRMRFCEICQKPVVITVKNHEKYEKKKKNTFFNKNQTLTMNYCHALKGELSLYMCGKNCMQDANILNQSLK